MIYKFIYYFLASFLFITPILLSIGIIGINNRLCFRINRNNKCVKYITNFLILLMGLFLSCLNISDSLDILEIANQINPYRVDNDVKSYIIKSLPNIDVNSMLDIEFSTISEEVEAISFDNRNLNFSYNFTECITTMYDLIGLENESLLLNCNDIVATDLDNGEKITVQQLSGEKLLVPYIENGKEILFYGEYNDKNHWNGICTFNIYENDELDTVMEAEYADGNLISYKKVARDETRGGVEIWNVCERYNEGNYTSGETWNYFRENKYEKSFDFDKVSIEDIKYFANLKKEIETFAVLEGNYIGNIVNGLYNDKTGNAYLTKYFKDGTVRMLYNGHFTDGFPDDNTGDAWYIVKGTNTDYMYYKGYFKDNVAVNNEGSYFENNLSRERINEILKENDCDFSINWYEASKEIDREPDIISQSEK